MKTKLKKITKAIYIGFPLGISHTDFDYNNFSIATRQLLNWQNTEYLKIFIMFFFIFVISFLLFLVAQFLSFDMIKDSEKLSQYECGFMPLDEATRHPFDVHFYVVGILFLIFDVEIALLFPWVLGLKEQNSLHFFTMVIFLVILTVGFFYEWHRGALIWPTDSKKEQKNLNSAGLILIVLLSVNNNNISGSSSFWNLLIKYCSIWDRNQWFWSVLVLFLLYTIVGYVFINSGVLKKLKFKNNFKFTLIGAALLAIFDLCLNFILGLLIIFFEITMPFGLPIGPMLYACPIAFSPFIFLFIFAIGLPLKLLKIDKNYNIIKQTYTKLVLVLEITLKNKNKDGLSIFEDQIQLEDALSKFSELEKLWNKIQKYKQEFSWFLIIENANFDAIHKKLMINWLISKK